MGRIRTAALARISDPAVIDVLIDKLSGPPRDRQPALRELQHLRERAVPHILRRLVANANPISTDVATTALMTLGNDAVAPLIGVLQGGPDQLRGLAANVLGMIGGKQAEFALWAPAFGTSSPEPVQQTARMALARIQQGDPQRVDLVRPFGKRNLLAERSREYLRQAVPLEAGDDQLVAVWAWDSAQAGLVEHRTTPEKASLYFAENYARQAVDLGGSAREPQVLLMAILLARDTAMVGWDQPLPEGPGTAHDLALQEGPQFVEDVLRLAMAEQQPGVAMAALGVLAQNGSSALLAGEAPVIAALDAPERQVQFAAVQTILQWDPTASFPHSRRVVEVLSQALTGDSRQDSVVIDPNSNRATLMGGYLNSLGFDPRIASTGQQGFEEATGGDVALAVVHLNSIRWDLSQTVANLRADSRTKALPIAVYGPSGLEDRARHLERTYPRVQYIHESSDPYEVSRQLRTLMAQVSPPPLTPDQRDNQRKAAAEWLEYIAEGQRTKIFDLRPAEAGLSDAVNDPKIADPALAALAAVPTATAQDRLSNVFLAEADPTIRAAAIRKLNVHIQRFGLLLADAQLDRLRSAAANETDPAVLTTLAAVAGSLKPNAERIREQLMSYPASTAPLPPSAAPNSEP
jgi:hypothetical protein